MLRSLPDLAASPFDLLVIGGGITGCCIARDAARRGMRVALVERHDFSAATSAATSRLVHGGLRYLREGQVGVVRESLRERRVWLRIAPHLVHPMRFLLPTTGRANDLLMRAGLLAYDALSWDGNRGLPASQRIPRARAWPLADALRAEPILHGAATTGVLMYGDAHSLAPERLAIGCLHDAVAHGAIVANYAEAVTLRAGPPHLVTVRDTLSSDEVEVRATTVLASAGPWADLVGQRLGFPDPPRLTRSKGIHLITRPLTREHALLVPVRGRHFFVIPWRGHSLIGTTDTPFAGSPDSLAVSDEDIDGFLEVVNEGLPGAALRRDDVQMAYAGLRPLVDSGPKATYQASRRSALRHHGGGLYSAIGGKWTTSRALAEECVDAVARTLGSAFRPCDTATTPLPDAETPGPSSMLEPSPTSSSGPFGVVPGGLTSDRDPREIARFCVTREMAMTLGDLVFRRTGRGTLAVVPEGELTAIAQQMAPLRSWSPDDIRQQVNDVQATWQRAGIPLD